MREKLVGSLSLTIVEEAFDFSEIFDFLVKILELAKSKFSIYIWYNRKKSGRVGSGENGESERYEKNDRSFHNVLVLYQVAILNFFFSKQH